MNDELDISEIYSVIGPKRTMDYICKAFHFERVMSAWRAQNELARLSGRTRSTAWGSLRRAVKRGQLAKCWPYEFDPVTTVRVQIGSQVVSVRTNHSNENVPAVFRRAAMLHIAYRIMHPRTSVTFSIVEGDDEYYYRFAGYISDGLTFYPLGVTTELFRFDPKGRTERTAPWQHPLSVYNNVLEFVKGTYSIVA